MKLFEEYAQVLLGDNMTDEVNFVKGFMAAMEVFGIDCPVPYDRNGKAGLLDPNLHIWVLGQIFEKNDSDGCEMATAEGIVANLYTENALGAALVDVGRAILNERGIIDTDKYCMDNSDEKEEAAKQEMADTPDSAVTNQQPAEQTSNDGVLTEAEITDLLGEDKQEDEAEQQAEVTGDPEVEQAEVVEDPEVEGIFYQRALLFRTENSKTYLTEKDLGDLPTEQRHEYSAYWVMIVTKDGESAFYDDTRRPAEYLGMLKQMEAAKAAKMAKNK